jgi:hypothetical protein
MRLLARSYLDPFFIRMWENKGKWEVWIDNGEEEKREKDEDFIR